MAPALSANWKKLQAELKQQRDQSGFEKKRGLEDTPTSPARKRRRIDARIASTRSHLPVQRNRHKGKMDTSRASESTGKPAPSASLALWAADNDISTSDLVAAYGSDYESKISQPITTDQINGGLIDGVEVGQYVAMDCEMVGVGGEEDRSVLARVSIVNFHGIQVYDSFVRPKEIVTDWRTQVSGISPKHMAAARIFEAVQQDVVKLLRDRVLVGHAIKNDLGVLMMTHPAKDIRDTSKFIGFRKYGGGRSPALKKLAKEILGVDIQEGEHSSIEDARATMLLFRRHRQAFDAEHARRFPQHKSKVPPQSKSKKKGKKS